MSPSSGAAESISEASLLPCMAPGREELELLVLRHLSMWSPLVVFPAWRLPDGDTSYVAAQGSKAVCPQRERERENQEEAIPLFWPCLGDRQPCLLLWSVRSKPATPHPQPFFTGRGIRLHLLSRGVFKNFLACFITAQKPVT